jgi:FSR family fosmidomycin resistance protein-like MFS transporter
MQTLWLLSVAHFVLDSYSSFLFALLPMLAVKLHLTPAQAGLLTPVLMISSSLMQPVYGMISDRWLARSMSVFGPLVTAVFISSIGLANSLPMLMTLVIIGGIGIGSFHPQSAALVSRAVSGRGGMVMSVFSSAGTIGYALGPVIIASVVTTFGLEKSWYTVFWGIAVWLLLLRYCPALERRPQNAQSISLTAALQHAWVPLTLLYFAVVFRSAVSVSVQTYLPFALDNSGLTTNSIGWVLAGFLFFGGVGGFFGGGLADRLGARRVSLIAMLLSTPLLLAAFSTSGMLSYALLMAGGTMLNLPIPISVVMAQRMVPGASSTVSALMMGFAWGAGALMAPVTGIISNRTGFIQALLLISLLPLISALLLWLYPKDGSSSHEVVLNSQTEALAMD